MNRNWLGPAKKTTAGAVRPIPVGLRISLGGGAEALIAAANAVVLGDDRLTREDKHKPGRKWNENDRSISVLVRYGEFEYLLDGDLGSGPERCSGHSTKQKNIQVPVAQALLDRGLIPETGIDVLHIAHHGSESSTSAEYFNLVRPRIALISVGWDKNDFDHPRVNVVNNVLIGPNRKDAPADHCVTAPAVEAVFQTEDGPNVNAPGTETSRLGTVVGDIRLSTDGRTKFTIAGSNRVHPSSRREAPPQPLEFFFQ